MNSSELQARVDNSRTGEILLAEIERLKKDNTLETSPAAQMLCIIQHADMLTTLIPVSHLSELFLDSFTQVIEFIAPNLLKSPESRELYKRLRDNFERDQIEIIAELKRG